jgi:hypothetical protein
MRLLMAAVVTIWLNAHVQSAIRRLVSGAPVLWRAIRQEVHCRSYREALVCAFIKQAAREQWWLLLGL